LLDIEIGPNDYLTNLNFALMVTGEARKGRAVIVSDLVYLDLSSERSTVRSIDFGGDTIDLDASLDVGSDTSLEGVAWTIAGGYSLSANPESPMEIIGGVRYFGVESATHWDLAATIDSPDGTRHLSRTGDTSKNVDLWDGIIGLRGRAKLGERWNLPYAFDAGTGSSALTWQAMGGVTYSFGWGDVGMVYRHLAYDQDDEELIQDFSFSGPAATFTFRF
jgi:hypothetical protein